MADTTLTPQDTYEPVSTGHAIDLDRAQQFYDLPHPAGIQTPHHQRHCTFATFNLSDRASKRDLQVLLATWTASAAMLMQGKLTADIEGTSERKITASKDDGETYDLDAASLAITFGFGPSLFDKFDLEQFRPAQLKPLPRIVGDPATLKVVDSDLSVLVQADDKQVVFHALRQLARAARPTAVLVHTQDGFMPTTQTLEENPPAPRNLFGFRDGTRNIATDEDFEEYVWLNNADQSWMEGGTYEVYRRMYMDIESWDSDRISDQETIFGRFKDSGAPLTGTDEYDDPDYDAVDENGDYVIAWNSHGRLLSYEELGYKILRRPFNYADGLAETGKLDAGLAFFFYINDMDNWIEMRQRMGKYDLLNEYITDFESGIWAVPAAPAKGHYIGEEFFA